MCLSVRLLIIPFELSLKFKLRNLKMSKSVKNGNKKHINQKFKVSLSFTGKSYVVETSRISGCLALSEQRPCKLS